MGQLAFVLGRSGSGKSYSLRGFSPGEVGVFSVAGKRLPFRSGLPVAYNATYQQIQDTLRANRLRCYVVDDATYLMEFENFERAEERGYEKYTQMARNFEQMLRCAARETSADTMVYVMLHPELDADGREKVKTVGRMIDERLCPEGLTSILLDCRAIKGEGGEVRHVFVTRNDGVNLAKTPPDLGLDEEIDNDLRAFDARVRQMWGMAPLTDEQE